MTDDERELTPANEPDADAAEAPEADFSADDDTLISEMEASVAPAEAAEDDYYSPPPPANDDWMYGDVDAALAAVASLSEIMPQREAEAEARADAKRAAPTFVPEMALPPMATLKRGRLGSLVPALLLIGVGAWLTLMTTSGTPPEPVFVAALVGGGIVISLLAHWLGTGRWSRGLLFVALAALLIAGVIVFSLQPTGLDPLRAYPLLLVAVGLAIGLAGLLARPFSPRLTIPGGLLIFGGVAGIAVTMDWIPSDLLTFALPLAPVVAVVVLVLWLLPLLFRRRRS